MSGKLPQDHAPDLIKALEYFKDSIQAIIDDYEQKHYLTAAETCKRLNKSFPTLQKMVRDGKIKQHDFGGAPMYRLGDVMEIIRQKQK